MARLLQPLSGRYDDYEPQKSEGMDDEDDYDRPRGLGAPSKPPPVAVDTTLTGDEAYQRRLAMSVGFQRASSPAQPSTKVTSAAPTFAPSVPYKSPPREPSPAPAKMSTFVPSVTFSAEDEEDIPGFGAPPPPPTVPRPTETGEEAFLRRMAMSQPRQPSPDSQPLAYNPFAPLTSVPPPSAAGLPTSGSILSEERVRSSREAAAAIAAKLKALAPPAGSSEPSGTSTPEASDQPAGSSKKYAVHLLLIRKKTKVDFSGLTLQLV